MKTTFSDGLTRRKRFMRRIFGVVVLFFVVLLMAPIWRPPASGGLWRVLSPLSNARDGFFGGMRAVGAEFMSKPALLAENALLKEQLTEAQARAADRDAIYQENLDLKRSFGRPDAAQDAVMGAVIARPPALPYDTLLIDAGSNLNITQGDVVVAAGGAIVGTISSVYSTTARVTLLSAAGETHEGFLHGSVPVVVEGKGGGALEAQVPPGTDVSADDDIVFPGIAGGLSEKVTRVDASSNDSFKTLYLQLPANPFSLRYVEVWRSKKL